MESLRRLEITVTIFIFLIQGCVNLDCKLYHDNEVICVGGFNDFILRKGVIATVPQATKIILNNCRISELEAGAFESAYYLQHLDLSENKLNSLQSGVLDGNLHVTHLNLSHNWLTTLPPRLFDQKINLLVLDLKGNRIISLPADVFVALRKLDHLYLSDNAITGKDLNPYIFGKNRKITYLDLSGNNMSNSLDNLLNGLQEIDFLNLDRCSLINVPLFATKANLRTMKHLILSTNKISRVDQPRTFIDLVNLETLDLAENLIESITANVFIYLKNIKLIMLRGNKLKSLPDGFFRNLGKLKTVDLSNNMLEYVPLTAFRGTAVQDLNLSHNRFSYLDVYFCSQLINAGIRINKFHIDENPWQCACLNEILIELKSFNIEYNDDKYDGGHAVCVTTKEFTCNRDLVDNNLFIEMYDAIIEESIN